MAKDSGKIVLPFGLWSSPVTAGMLSSRLRLDDVQWDTEGSTIVWLEGRGDRGVLVSKPKGEACKELTEGLNIRGGVGYGGGDFTVVQGQVFFVEKDGRLYRKNLGHENPTPIAPAYGGIASPALSPDGRWVVFVFSDGKVDLLGLVAADGCQWQQQLVKGADFYMQPAWHPDGERLAWIEWDHPNMPWDGTRLKMARLHGTPPHVGETAILAGNENIPVCQPRFSPDGKWLSFIESSGEWDDLVVMDLENGSRRTLVKGEKFHLAIPAWAQGMHSYGWDRTGQVIYYLRNYAGWGSLWRVDIANGESTEISVLPYTWLSQLSVSPLNDELVFIASAESIPDRVVRWDGRRLTIEARSEGETLAPEFLAVPEPLEWKAPDGTIVHAIYYAPTNPEFTSPGLPPVILNIHGGPTSQTPARYAPETAYFTSRGYGWLEVNYRGSTGYGKTYMQSLRQNWGKYDVEDAVGGAQALITHKLADPHKLVIKGRSAGGYTVLNALEQHPGKFKAGICLFGVSNLFNLAMDTHKFEARYMDSMVGPLPEAAARYHEWSPIFHVDRIRDAVAIFQGNADKVVPPYQSEEIVVELRRRGIPHIYRLYEGEGHGFRKQETIADYLEQTERFLRQFVLFSV
jgi:dipeptidyl aminopeptidase/acylaminoacyl peptidase